MKCDYDLSLACASLAVSDTSLGTLIAEVGPCRLAMRAPLSPFQELLRAIVYQQLSGRAASAIFARLCALFPGRRAPTARDILAVDESALRAAGLSRAKAAAVKDLAEKTARRVVPGLARLRRMPDQEIVERLTAVRGVGRWTVEMMLIFQLGRGDVLPATDLGVRKGFLALYGADGALARDGLPGPARVLAHGERWRPYRSVAAWYLWRADERARPGRAEGA